MPYTKAQASTLLCLAFKSNGSYPHRRRLYRLWQHRKVVQTLLDQQPYDPIAVEQEVASRGVLVPDDGEECLELGGRFEREDGRGKVGHFFSTRGDGGFGGGGGGGGHRSYSISNLLKADKEGRGE